MATERWQISMQKTLLQSDLLKLKMPWYLDASNKQVEYDNGDARSTSISEAVQKMACWRLECRLIIAKYLAIFQAATPPIEAMFPVYEIPGGQLILDGNHRAVALAISNQRFELSLAVLRGPIDRDALPDLIHWAR